MVVVGIVGLMRFIPSAMIAFRWRIVFFEDRIETRDWLGRLRGYGYEAIEEII